MCDWQPVTLGDVCTMRRGISYSGNEVRDAEGIPFLTIKVFNKGGGFSRAGLKYFSGADVPSHRLKVGDMLIANTDVTRDADIIGAPVLVPELDDAPLFSMDVNQLLLYPESVSARFLFYLLCTGRARKFMKGHSAGSTVLHLHVKDVPTFRFDLPPLAEQYKIAQILDTLNTQIRQTEALIAKLERIKQGLLTDLLTRGIDQNGQLRPAPEQAPHLYKDSSLGQIPREWECLSLGEIYKQRSKNGIYKPSSYRGRGYPMVQMGGMFKGYRVDFSSASFIELTTPEIETFGLAEGDLLFARRSLVLEGAGLCCIVENLSGIATFESSIVRVRLDKTKASPEFVCLFMRSEQAVADRRKYIRQVAVSGVSGDDIRQFLTALPSLKEQQDIVSKHRSIEAQIDTEQKRLAKLQTEKSGLMDDLLTGRVRVTPLLEAKERATA